MTNRINSMLFYMRMPFPLHQPFVVFGIDNGIMAFRKRDLTELRELGYEGVSHGALLLHYDQRQGRRGNVPCLVFITTHMALRN